MNITCLTSILSFAVFFFSYLAVAMNMNSECDALPHFDCDVSAPHSSRDLLWVTSPTDNCRPFIYKVVT